MTSTEATLLSDLHSIVGDRGLLTGTDVTLRSCDPFRAVPPEGPAIVRPASTGELSQIMALCHARGQRVVVHGGRTGVAGGAYAGPAEIVISLERMARIVEIDPVGLTATVEAGATVEAVQNAAMEQGLLYPIDLGAKGSATIGGTIATNAGGNRVIRWGMTRQNVLGLEAVLSDGTIVSAMNRYLKNNTGYDVKQLFIGSEGTLGVVSRAVLKLVAQPRTQLVAFLSLSSFQAVLDLLVRARRLQQLSAFEVMWQDYYAMVAGHDATRRPVDPSQPFYVLLELMGFDEAADQAAFNSLLEEAFDAGLIVDAVAATSLKQVGELWRVREGSEILVREMAPFISFDISVDIRRADAFAQAVRQALTTTFGEVKIVTFGHLGDSNLHIGAHIGSDTLARAHEIEATVYAVVRQFDGALTAEHGIGQMKRDFLPDHVDAGALTLMRRVRDALDGTRIINHDVLF
ncbi:FAD-binding protein [Niveispirillum sp. SYP-B3756]|uniref:FAD-binding oxidoreductase n=1 Tax=Niveispirillum sp. SYP-B3756 TaxID=2662178 RepID=UPI00129104CE|nr:FAD-binding oxidoreductase [Niveispirillum sp. SYP-B3756]MQP68337.1 FAD-binding protein [Niveispirillum sp. SYP-B3756]